VIEAILPAGVAAEEAFSDQPGVVLFPEEEAVIAKAVGKRRREFTTTRACARTALARLGLPPVPIVPGLRGAPQWPAGVVGSMTHCAGYRACAVARDRDLLTIGLDAEPHGQLPEGVLGAVSLAEEREQLAALAAAAPGTHWDRMLFSAKESVYKAWFPLTERWLGFAEASVSINPDRRTFTAQLLVDGPELANGPLTSFTGRWLVADGLIITAIAVPRTS
jgi:4'-phosphopantetheinyl transferase EntD